MSRGKLMAEVWPSRLALEQRRAALGRARPGGLFLGQSLFTFEGRHSLLNALQNQHNLPEGRQPLAELAGPLLVQGLLRGGPNDEPLFSGLARGRRLPQRLWRLLLQLKAAGLAAGDLAELASQGQSPRLEALARLLSRYEQALAERRLADQADRLAGLVLRLQDGHIPAIMESWSGLEVRQALWLRPLDLRLLKALAGVLPVRVRFGLLEPRQDPRDVFRLLRRTAEFLEAGQGGELEVAWADLPIEGGPLAGLALAALDPTAELTSPEAGRVELMRAPGRYAEVEALVRRALTLVEQGVAHHDIALVFPDLGLYGPMAVDVAARLGLALRFRRGEPLKATPLVQDFLALLELPLTGYERTALARVWQSPYLGPALARALAPSWGQEASQRLGQEVAPQAGRLLLAAGYVDARETPASTWLGRAARRRGAARPGLEDLARACAWLADCLAPLARAQGLAEYAGQAGLLLDKLDLFDDIGTGLSSPPPDWAGPKAGLDPAALPCRDQAARQGLGQVLASLQMAAEQVGAGEALNPGRLLAITREALGEAALAEAGGATGGVQVLRLEDAQGLSLHTLLVGGLNQGSFPQRPAQNLLAGPERLALGRRAGLPVWRTEDEEYGGQVLRLLLLLAQARQGAVLSSAAADAQGREQAPSFVLSDLARRLGRPLPAPAGGVYGELCPLPEALEPLALWGGLSAELVRPRRAGQVSQPGGGWAGLALAALWSLAQEPGQARRWRTMAQRAWGEDERLALDQQSGQARVSASGPFSGRLQTPEALDLLGRILAQEALRRLSPSQLETYAVCPQAWFQQRLLGLRVPLAPGWDLERRGEGEWVHRTLALFFTPQEYDPAWTPAQRAGRLEHCLDQALLDLRQGGEAGHDLVWQARRGALAQALGRVVEAEVLAMGELRPWAVELVFGEEEALEEGLTVEVGQGPRLRLKGRLDRLDRGEDRARVVDYKHGHNETNIRNSIKQSLAGLTSFQVPVYLAAAASLWPGQELHLAGRVVPTSLVGLKLKELGYPPQDPFLASNPALRRRLAEEGQPNLFNAIAGLWARLASGDFVPRPGPACQYCDLAPVCRAKAQASARDEAQNEAEDGPGEGADA